MKRLNNSGWSLGTMIGLLCVLILFILVVSFLAHQFGDKQEEKESSYTQGTVVTEKNI